jgi:two-component system NtrC family sensor kinase
MQKHSLTTLLNECLELTKIKANKFNTKVSIKLIPDSEVICDDLLIQQVLMNLINNAIEENEHRPSSSLFLLVTKESTYLEIAVTDSGPGISQEIANKIFTPFYTTKGLGKGTGLGLSICPGIMKDITESFTTKLVKVIPVL